MLMQIPGISLCSAKAISDKYMNMTNLLNSLNVIQQKNKVKT